MGEEFESNSGREAILPPFELAPFRLLQVSYAFLS
jgi:hypothetical protein